MRRGRAGFTLIELTLTTALLAVVLGSALLLTLSSHDLYTESTARAEVQEKAQRALSRLVAELSFADRDTFLPDAVGIAGTDDLRFNTIESVAGGAAVLGVPLRLWREADPADPDDGVDNDGDGVIDEGRLVLLRDEGGPVQVRTILVSHVSELFEGETPGNLIDDNGNGVIDETGFFVRRDGNLLLLGVSLEGALRDGRTVAASMTTTLALRN